MNWPEQGIHHNVPFDVYRACDLTNADTHVTSHDKSVSKSLICDFIKDAAAWKKRPKKKATKAMKAGSLFDCLMTTPMDFDDNYVISKYDKFQSNEAKEWRAHVEGNGYTVVTESALDDARQQVAAVYSKPEAVELLNGASFQVAYRHKTKHPFQSKGLIDIVPVDGITLCELKSCEPRALESHRALSKHLHDWNYHIGAGANCEGYSHASGEERHRFKFIFVGSAAPWTVAVVELPLAAILHGADIYRRGVNQLAECLELNKWPSMWDGEVELDLPEWAYNQKD